MSLARALLLWDPNCRQSIVTWTWGRRAGNAPRLTRRFLRWSAGLSAVLLCCSSIQRHDRRARSRCLTARAASDRDQSVWPNWGAGAASVTGTYLPAGPSDAPRALFVEMVVVVSSTRVTKRPPTTERARVS
jgi:hypothetical protein